MIKKMFLSILFILAVMFLATISFAAYYPSTSHSVSVTVDNTTVSVSNNTGYYDNYYPNTYNTGYYNTYYQNTYAVPVVTYPTTYTYPTGYYVNGLPVEVAYGTPANSYYYYYY